MENNLGKMKFLKSENYIILEIVALSVTPQINNTNFGILNGTPHFL